MRRSDFIKSLGIVPALFLLPKLPPAIKNKKEHGGEESLDIIQFWDDKTKQVYQIKKSALTVIGCQNPGYSVYINNNLKFR